MIRRAALTLTLPIHGRVVAGWAARVVAGVVGVVCLLILLSLLAATPVLQLIAFGYLLEAGGRMARDGAWRHCLPHLALARRIGFAILGTLLVLAPWAYLGDVVRDARVIDPTSPLSERLEFMRTILLVFTSVHVAIAWRRGGRFSYFVRPIANIRWLGKSAAPDRERSHRSPDNWPDGMSISTAWRYLTLGARGYLLTAAWLVIPTAMLSAGRGNPGIGWLGAIFLSLVVAYVPFAQLRFAASERWQSAFDVRAIRAGFRRAPIASLAGLFLTVLLALPLYLLSIETIPADVVWMPSLLFVAFALPVKLACGWSLYRAQSRIEPRRWWIVWPCRLLIVPTVVAYVGIVFLTQYTGWQGARGLYRHHAFLLPSPF